MVTDTPDGSAEEMNPTASLFSAEESSDMSPNKAPERSIATASKAIRELRFSVIFLSPESKRSHSGSAGQERHL